MKKIPITKRQQVKLREMIRVLYPEYDSRLTRPFFEKDDVCFVQISLKTVTKYDQEIHWFEFCLEICQTLAMKHRLVAIQNNFMYVTVHYKFWNEDKSKIHPIDFLYQEFKELKL